MPLLLPLSPLLLVMASILLWRRPAWQAAGAGLALALLLWCSGGVGAVSASVGLAVLGDGGLLFASVALVIAPGLLSVLLLERAGVNHALAQWVAALGLSPRLRLMFIILGLAPMLEAMTGFGVSLVLTVPLLLTLLPRDHALRVALCGMAIMPWGTLGLATLVGASLLQLPAAQLASLSAFSSGPVFLLLLWLGLYFAGCRRLVDYLLAAAGCGLFLLLLYAISRLFGPELAGVGAGATLAALLLLQRRWQGALPALPRAAWPYLALLLLIVALKALGSIGDAAARWTLDGVVVQWKVLASPGWALLLLCLLLQARQPQPLPWAGWWARAQRPLLTIALFLLLSQLLLKGGFLHGLGDGLAALAPAWHAPLLAALGGVAGYLTGSNVGGNVIIMPLLHGLIGAGSAPLPLAAIVNSAAGHAALGSLPMVAIVVGLAQGSAQEERGLIRFALLLVLCHTALVALAGSLLLVM